MDERQREFVLREQMKPDPEGARRGRGRRQRSSPSSSRRSPNAGMPEEVEKQAQQGAEAPGAHARGVGRVLDGAHLPRLADRAAVEDARADARSTSPRRAASSTRTTTASRRSRSASSSSSRCASSTRRAAPDPVLRRPARRGQDLARPEHRARARAQVRARLARRRARRGRDPRPPPHLHRRAAGQHHPGDQEGRQPRLRDDARRDRQARRRASTATRRRRCSRCSIRSRTTRSATTTSACRSTCRRCCSSPPRTCSTRSRARCATAWRSSSSPATREEEKLEIAQALPRPAPARGERPQAGPGADRRRGARGDHPRLHARGGRAQPRARDRRGAARTSRCDRGGRRRRRCGSTCQRPRGDPRAGAVRGRGGERTACPGVATGLAWTPVGGDILFIEASRMPGAGKLILTGQLGDVMKESAQAALTLVKSRAGSLWHRPGGVREERHPRARAGGRDPEGRAERGRGDVHGAGLAAHRSRRCATTSR